MIFVTVGTHEQGFDRLVKEVDRLKKEQLIEDKVFIQKGYTAFTPQCCDYCDFLSHDSMTQYMLEADMVICHGGPATFMQALALGKKTIIVPRLKQFQEHVNNHQLDFLQHISREQIGVTIVTDIIELRQKISEADSLTIFQTNTAQFCKSLSQLIDEL